MRLAQAINSIIHTFLFTRVFTVNQDFLFTRYTHTHTRQNHQNIMISTFCPSTLTHFFYRRGKEIVPGEKKDIG